MNLMGYFFLISWMPTLLSNAHVPLGRAALVTALLQLGGVIGGLNGRFAQSRFFGTASPRQAQ